MENIYIPGGLCAHNQSHNSHISNRNHQQDLTAPDQAAYFQLSLVIGVKLMQIEKLSTDLPPSGAQTLDLAEQIGTSLYTDLCFTCLLQSLKHSLENFYLFNDHFQVDALAGLRGARHATLVAFTARTAAH